MSAREKDEDEKAEELLPCTCSKPEPPNDFDNWGNQHWSNCPALYRSTVAADRRALAAAHKAEVERLRRDSAEQYSAMFIGKDKVITALRERLAQAEKERDIITVNSQRKVLFTGADIQRAAHIAGLEWTLNNCAGLSPSDVDLLKAEIEKCRK